MFGEEGKGPRYGLVLCAAAFACLILPAAAAATTRYRAKVRKLKKKLRRLGCR
jgi:hypothetical protein